MLRPPGSNVSAVSYRGCSLVLFVALVGHQLATKNLVWINQVNLTGWYEQKDTNQVLICWWWQKINTKLSDQNYHLNEYAHMRAPTKSSSVLPPWCPYILHLPSLLAIHFKWAMLRSHRNLAGWWYIELACQLWIANGYHSKSVTSTLHPDGCLRLFIYFIQFWWGVSSRMGLWLNPLATGLTHARLKLQDSLRASPSARQRNRQPLKLWGGEEERDGERRGWSRPIFMLFTPPHRNLGLSNFRECSPLSSHHELLSSPTSPLRSLSLWQYHCSF